MEQITAKRNGIEIECQVKTEWSDWSYSEFIKLYELFSKLTPEMVEKIQDATKKTNEKTNVMINTFYRNVLLISSTIPEDVIANAPIDKIVEIISRKVLNQLYAFIAHKIFCDNPEIETQEYGRLFNFTLSEDFKAKNFKEVVNSRIPIPTAPILTITASNDYYMSVVNEFKELGNAIDAYKNGCFRSLPMIAALYETIPYDEDVLAENLTKFQNANMQELISFFVCIRGAVSLLQPAAPGFSVELKSKPEAIQETSNPDTSVTTT